MSHTCYGLDLTPSAPERSVTPTVRPERAVLVLSELESTLAEAVRARDDAKRQLDEAEVRVAKLEAARMSRTMFKINVRRVPVIAEYIVLAHDETEARSVIAGAMTDRREKIINVERIEGDVYHAGNSRITRRVRGRV